MGDSVDIVTDINGILCECGVLVDVISTVGDRFQWHIICHQVCYFLVLTLLEIRHVLMTY